MAARQKGAVAAGHPLTAHAAFEVLQDGGNAFDATLAAFCASCVVEPVLASLGGGGFMLTKPHGASPMLYDFFAQTPHMCVQDADFYPILADFGTVTQEFHIGMGAIATPGAVRGLFEIHRDLGHMPLRTLMQPAMQLAKEGVRVDAFQSYLFEVVGAIYSATPTCHAQFASPANPQKLIGEGDLYQLSDFADVLDALAHEGDDLFYRGEIAQAIVKDCVEGGGHLRMEDMQGYCVERRQPLAFDFSNNRLYTNPPPSTGGILIAFALALLEGADFSASQFGNAEHLRRMASVMEQTNAARMDSDLHQLDAIAAASLLSPDFVEQYRTGVLDRPKSLRGTTHISVADGAGNMAGMTISNGEGSAYVVPKTGIVLNNMLGEEDINPHGFGAWPTNCRMSSMMSPSLLCLPNGDEVMLGSGGSNRIRTALLQVLMNLTVYRMSLKDAVEAPRIHAEGGQTHIESGFDDGAVESFCQDNIDVQRWTEKNLFFGGVHAVRHTHNGAKTGGLEGAGDPRRAGVAVLL